MKFGVADQLTGKYAKSSCLMYLLPVVVPSNIANMVPVS